MTETEKIVEGILLNIANSTHGIYSYDNSHYGMGFYLSWHRPLGQLPPNYILAISVSPTGDSVVSIGCALSKPGFKTKFIFSEQLGRFDVHKSDIFAIVMDKYTYLDEMYRREVDGKSD